MGLLKRPQPLPLETNIAAAVDAMDTAKDGAGGVGGASPVPSEKGKVKPPVETKAGTEGFLDKVVAALKDVPLDVDSAMDEPLEQDEEQAGERNSLFDSEPVSRIKRYFKQDDKAMLADFNLGLIQNLKQSRPELKRTLARMRANYFSDLGGKENCSEMVTGTVDAILRAELLSHLIFTEGLKAGIVRFNRSNRKLTLNPALEQYPKFENLARLLRKTLHELSKSGRTVQRATFEYAVDEHTSRAEAQERAEEFAQLLGEPLDVTKLKKITLEQRKE